MINIRRIRIGDCEVYKEIRLKALKEAPYAFLTKYESAIKRTDDEWNNQVSEAALGTNQAIFIVFTEENTPIGLAALFRSLPKQISSEVAQVWISPEYRKRGIGKDLLREVIIWSKEHGIIEIEAKIMEGNEQAIEFYRNNKFTEVRIEKQNSIKEYVLSYKII